MPINVVCPGCKKRFAVSDKFAGKQGPCPKCKTMIRVPDKTEEVVIHAPEDFGPKDSKGRAVLKPIARRETKVSLLLTGAIVAAALAVLVVAWMFRSPDGDVPPLLLVVGALGLAPGLVWGGYAFLRDDELEAFQGRELWIRVGACSLVYALLWALVPLITQYGLRLEQLELIHMAFIAPVLVGLGAFTAYVSLDFDFGVGALHYGLYLTVTVLLRLILGLPAL
jgi:hypothetical protein